MTWAIVVFWGVLLDDHFGRITLGYQWLTYGDVPFRDFFDPGLFGAAAWSALALSLSGGTLLGEMILDGAAIGVGLGITCALAARAACSKTVGVFCAALTLTAGPRLYDYDKVLLYPLGLWACWRYADHPSSRRALTVGVVVGLGAILRYDTALYLGAAWMVTLLATHGLSKGWHRPAALSILTMGILATPVVLWVQSTVELRDAIDQIATYARNERSRSVLFDWSSVLLHGSGRQAWAAVMSRGPSAGGLYLGILLLPPLAIAAVFSNRRGAAGFDRTIAKPHILSAAALCAVLSTFILRDPLPARFGGMLSIASVLIASIAGWWLCAERTAANGRVTGLASLHGSLWRWGFSLVLGAAIAITVFKAGEIDRYERLWLGGPWQVAYVARAQARMLTEEPPALGIMPGGIVMRSLAWYLRQCTPPGTPVMATWFAPHVYYFAQRPFAGGMWAFFGDHWARPDRQAQVIDRLQQQPPSIVVVDSLRYGDFEQSYSLIADYLQREYRVAGSTSFERGTAATYEVLVLKGAGWSGRDPVWGLPCQ